MSAPADDKPPFQLQVGYDQDELLGGRWWQESLRPAPGASRRQTRGVAPTDESRRTALRVLFALGGFGLVVGVAARCSGNRGGSGTVDRASLDLQRTQGLATGAEQVPFEWPHALDKDQAGTPLAQIPLATLANDLRPPRAQELPDYVPTLFQCLAGPGGDAFARAFRLVHSPAMATAYARGEAVRELLDVAEARQEWALVVDLPGPESIAFVAALQPRAVAVFTFDNWPHPRGVVPAHLTLSAAAYYRERFVGSTSDEPRAVAYVLDRKRLLPYQNEPDRFDNRYAVRLPTAPSLRERGITRLLYVVPDGAPEAELDDLAARFLDYENGGITVRMLGLADVTLAPAAADQPGTKQAANQRYYWHGTPAHHFWFWNHYGWASRPSAVTPQRPPASSFGTNWSPRPRSSPLAGLDRVGRTQTRSSGGSSSRSGGSWGRSSGGFGG